MTRGQRSTPFPYGADSQAEADAIAKYADVIQPLSSLPPLEFNFAPIDTEGTADETGLLPPWEVTQ